MSSSSPNILLLIADDQRHSMLGCCDGPTADAVSTPHLDQLASTGLRFNNAFHAGSAVGAVCSPSRAMLHTGRAPHRLPQSMIAGSCEGFFVEGSAATMGELLQSKGYHTHHVGKWHNHEESFQRSFTSGGYVFSGGMSDHFHLPTRTWSKGEWHNEYAIGCHSSDIFQAGAQQFLEDHTKSSSPQPFLLSVAFTAPHDPRETHAVWHERYDSKDMTIPPNYRDKYVPFGPENRIRDEMLIPLPRHQEQVQKEIADYYAMTEHMDYAIGQIIAKLDELGLRENTLIIHTADHGLAVGQHGLMGKQNMYDHSVRVPLILNGPSIPAGNTSNALCYQHDLFPTLLETAGIIIPDDCAFRSLLPIVTGERTEIHDSIFSFYGASHQMIRTKNRKRIEIQRDEALFIEEYDLENDPWEITPGQHPEWQLENKLAEWREKWPLPFARQCCGR